MTQSKSHSVETEELLEFIAYRISMVHAKLNAQAAHILRESGGISLLQWRIIALVRVFGPAVSSTEIIDIIGIDKGLFSRTVKNLVEAGLVRGDTDADDHRAPC